MEYLTRLYEYIAKNGVRQKNARYDNFGEERIGKRSANIPQQPIRALQADNNHQASL